MPETVGTPEGPHRGSGGGPLDERRGPKRAEDAEPAPPLTPEDAEVGGWIDACARVEGGMEAFAALIGVDVHYLKKMRKGQKPLAGRHLVKMKGRVEAVLTITAPLLESIGHVARPVAGPSYAQLAAAVLADLDDGSAVTRSMIERAAAKRGWSVAQVSLALYPDPDKP